MRRFFWAAMAVVLVMLTVTADGQRGPLRVSFNAGEVSPMILYRVDIQQYDAACQVMENMLVIPQGAAVRRPGTEFIAQLEMPN